MKCLFNKFIIVYSLIAMIIGFPALALADDNSKFYIDGQIHPAFSIKISINEKLVKEIMPDEEKSKIFVFDVDKSIIITGDNKVSVQYSVLRNIDKDVGSNRSFRFNIRYQADMENSETTEKLIKVYGPKSPFSAVGTSDNLTETFKFIF